MRKVRFGIIGAGGIADRRTMPGMLLSETVEICAVMEIDEKKSIELKEKYGAKYAYTSAEELISNPEVEAVYIASPVVFHASQAKLCADYGKHVLIEKPIAMTYEEGKEVIEYCDAHNIKTAAGFMMRFGSHAQSMKKIISDGGIGKPLMAYGQFSCFCPPESGNWRFSKAKSGGGALMDMGIHCIDLLEYVLSSKAKRVAALSSCIEFDSEVEDTASLLIEMENGAQCTVCTSFATPDQIVPQKIEIYGTEGRLLANKILSQRDTGELLAIYSDKNREYDAQQNGVLAEEVSVAGCFGNLYTKEVDSFAKSIIEDTEPVASAKDALRVQKIIELAYKSNEENKFFNI